MLAAAVVGGTALGLHREVPVEAVAVLLALLGGGVMLNVLKEELPAERDSRLCLSSPGQRSTPCCGFSSADVRR